MFLFPTKRHCVVKFREYAFKDVRYVWSRKQETCVNLQYSRPLSQLAHKDVGSNVLDTPHSTPRQLTKVS